MNDERLKELLRRADSGTAVSVESERVREAAARRGRRRIGVRVAGVVMVAGLGVAGWWGLRGDARRVADGGIKAVRAAGGNDGVAAEVRERIAVETAIRLAKVHAKGDYWAHDPALVRERAAETLVVAADRGRARGDVEDAAATYALAARLFPETEAVRGSE
jgi:hypothetical protein